jgi:hypothetical protein
VTFSASDANGLKAMSANLDGNPIGTDVEIDPMNPETTSTATVGLSDAQCTGTHTLTVSTTDVGDHVVPATTTWKVGKVSGSLAKKCKKIACDSAKAATQPLATNYSALRRQQRTLQNSIHNAGRGPKKNRPAPSVVADWKNQRRALSPQVKAAKKALDAARKKQRKICR